MQLVAVDIGNSSAKIAIEHVGHDQFTKEDRWCEEAVFKSEEPFELGPQFKHPDQPYFWAVSSVNQKTHKRLGQWVAAHRSNDVYHLIEVNDIEIETAVESPDQVGRDRLVAAWQAVKLNSGGPVIVIDAGTAVTIDFVDADSVFQGGMIFPGATSSLLTLCSQTDALPDLSSKGLEDFDTNSELGFIGKSTETAILLGVYQTQISSIKTAVEKLTQSSDSTPAVFLTGRGMEAIVTRLPGEWQYIPDLVLQGARGIGMTLVEQIKNSQ